ncbi:4Fe-4S binding protein, partial [Planctomycetota bacterium]
LWGSKPLPGMEAVSGATFTSEAVLTILHQSGRRFAESVLFLEGDGLAEATVRKTPDAYDRAGIFFVLFFLLSFIAILRGRGQGLRLVLLAASLGLFGLWFTMQYSTEQVIALLDGRFPRVGLTIPFVLLIALPVLLLFCGNIYCGYLCPFGALQELLSLLWPERYKPTIDRKTLRRWRFVKYLLLFVIVIACFVGGKQILLMSDPLTWIFKPSSIEDAQGTLAQGMHWFTVWRVGIVVAVLLAMLMLTRFWCRFICPAGAFLSLANHATWLRRWLPKLSYGRCEFGLMGCDYQDCIHCDRCRFVLPGVTVPPSSTVMKSSASRWATGYIRLVIVAVLLAWLTPALRSWLPKIRSASAYETTIHETPGIIRKVNISRIETMIRNGQLSNHEALYYQLLQRRDDPNEGKP